VNRHSAPLCSQPQCDFDQNKDDGIVSHLLKSELPASSRARTWRHQIIQGTLYHVLRSHHDSKIGVILDSMNTPTTRYRCRLPGTDTAEILPPRGHFLIACTPWTHVHCEASRMTTIQRGASPATKYAYYSSQVSFRRHPNVVIITFSIYHLIRSALEERGKE